MSELNYILDQALPIDQSFAQLKEEGLDFLQEKSGTNWTNFNAADPGITILDQVCYALTELGYCISFPMVDMLTNSNNKLELKNQFYLPNEILTSTPITIDDYRKLIIDASAAVGNVCIRVNESQLPGVSAIYKVYIRLADNLSASFSAEDLNNQLYYLLNSNRNLADFFDVPRILTPKQVTLYGQIEISNSNDFGDILNEIITSSSEVIFPVCSPISYKEARAEGYDYETIYNGPRLKNGFIPTDKLDEKRNTFTTVQLTQAVQHIQGVNKISNLQFSADESISAIHSKADELITFDWTGSIQQGLLVFKADGVILSLDQVSLPNQSQTASVPIAIKSKSEIIPEGVFRDINSYYSIQNTFPAIYNIGESNSGNKSNTLKTAQANQLKGYLTLYDQVLANQFAQLANIGQIFSFKNGLTAAPSDLKAFNAVKNKLNPKPGQYPAPYRAFSPTYFCQSIYDTPNIRPLLKDNEVFNFTAEKLTAKELNEQSWKAYKLDPYNAYMNGLLDLTIDEEVNLIQRNKVLNHLLARHGESPEEIDQIIKGSQYTGSKEMDQVIFKSLYLQNIDSLSYNKPKAFDCYAAKRLNETLPEMSDEILDKGLEGFSRDFIFSSTTSDSKEKINNSDYTNYAGIELKTNLLFGLTPLYEDFITENLNNNDNLIQVQQAFWLNNQQKGSITIETGLLFMGLKASVVFQIGNDDSYYWQIVQEVNYYELSGIRNALVYSQLKNGGSTVEVYVNGATYTLNKVDGQMETGSEIFRVNDAPYIFNLDYQSAITEADTLALLSNHELLLLYPSYITVLKSEPFFNRLHGYLKANLPVYQDFKIDYVNAEALSVIIPTFAIWRNSMRYTNSGMPNPDTLSSATKSLLSTLNDYLST